MWRKGHRTQGCEKEKYHLPKIMGEVIFFPFCQETQITEQNTKKNSYHKTLITKVKSQDLLN